MLQIPKSVGARRGLAHVGCAVAAETRRIADEEVGQLMFDHVWNELNLLGPEMTVCKVATERLLNSSSVVTTEKENLEQ